MKPSIHNLTFAFLLGISTSTFAQTTDHNAHHSGAAQAAPASAAMVDAEVRKVDMDAKKITLRHGPIPNLEMPAMTMVFQVKEPSMLDKAKTGDKVKFTAEKIGGAYTVTRIEPAN
jgi:Cu(I)/Ag(I) efflux system protein CusF